MKYELLIIIIMVWAYYEIIIMPVTNGGKTNAVGTYHNDRVNSV